jgi:hypothetical protein
MHKYAYVNIQGDQNCMCNTISTMILLKFTKDPSFFQDNDFFAEYVDELNAVLSVIQSPDDSDKEYFTSLEGLAKNNDYPTVFSAFANYLNTKKIAEHRYNTVMTSEQKFNFFLQECPLTNRQMELMTIALRRIMAKKLRPAAMANPAPGTPEHALYTGLALGLEIDPQSQFEASQFIASQNVKLSATEPEVLQAITIFNQEKGDQVIDENNGIIMSEDAAKNSVPLFSGLVLQDKYYIANPILVYLLRQFKFPFYRNEDIPSCLLRTNQPIPDDELEGFMLLNLETRHCDLAWRLDDFQAGDRIGLFQTPLLEGSVNLFGNIPEDMKAFKDLLGKKSTSNLASNNLEGSSAASLPLDQQGYNSSVAPPPTGEKAALLPRRDWKTFLIEVAAGIFSFGLYPLGVFIYTAIKSRYSKNRGINQITTPLVPKQHADALSNDLTEKKPSFLKAFSMNYEEGLHRAHFIELHHNPRSRPS